MTDQTQTLIAEGERVMAAKKNRPNLTLHGLLDGFEESRHMLADLFADHWKTAPYDDEAVTDFMLKHGVNRFLSLQKAWREDGFLGPCPIIPSELQDDVTAIEAEQRVISGIDAVMNEEGGVKPKRAAHKENV